MAENVTQQFTEANGRLSVAVGAGKPFPIERFSNKSFHLKVVGSGDYTLQLSNDKSLDPASFFDFATGLTIDDHFFFTESEVAAERLPEAVFGMRIVTVVRDAATIGRFQGHDPR